MSGSAGSGGPDGVLERELVGWFRSLDPGPAPVGFELRVAAAVDRDRSSRLAANRTTLERFLGRFGPPLVAAGLTIGVLLAIAAPWLLGAGATAGPGGPILAPQPVVPSPSEPGTAGANVAMLLVAAGVVGVLVYLIARASIARRWARALFVRDSAAPAPEPFGVRVRQAVRSRGFWLLVILAAGLFAPDVFSVVTRSGGPELAVTEPVWLTLSLSILLFPAFILVGIPAAAKTDRVLLGAAIAGIVASEATWTAMALVERFNWNPVMATAAVEWPANILASGALAAGLARRAHVSGGPRPIAIAAVAVPMSVLAGFGFVEGGGTPGGEVDPAAYLQAGAMFCGLMITVAFGWIAIVAGRLATPRWPWVLVGVLPLATIWGQIAFLLAYHVLPSDLEAFSRLIGWISIGVVAVTSVALLAAAAGGLPPIRASDGAEERRPAAPAREAVG